MNIKKTLIHVILPLLIGGLIYISFRSQSLRMFNWFEIVEVDTITSWIRFTFGPIKSYLPPWLYFSLPNGLWVYSFTSALLLLWVKQPKSLKLWLIIPLASSVLIEIIQGINLIPGTFDSLDLTICILTFTLSILLIKPQIISYEKNIS